MKPPPGSLWPRKKTKIETSRISGISSRVAVERMSEFIAMPFVRP